ncbi:MAG: endonuclease/exonuclease/phosphatase family protein [Kiritimatiellae bacterium]|nr:endonuclease/exonuclease/phosphatase family protein [Kiritimatiellia bacterium]MDD4622331.1 endonuclease/exonuclease/phosphatase family protein [Kiritimatiellia bacterium]
MRLLLHNIQYATGRLRRFAWVETLTRSTAHFPNITRFVRNIDPDIIGLVEVDSGSYRARRKNQANELARALKYYHLTRIKYPESGIGRHVPVLNKQANAVLARGDILRHTFHDFASGFKSLAIEVELENITFFLVHLALGIRTRHRQLLELHDLIKSSSKPVIAAGDFNTLSGVWEMRMFLRATGLKSANAKHSPTFPSWAPCRELDFICHDPAIKPVRFKIPRVRLSDHLPLVLDFELQ